MKSRSILHPSIVVGTLLLAAGCMPGERSRNAAPPSAPVATPGPVADASVAEREAPASPVVAASAVTVSAKKVPIVPTPVAVAPGITDLPVRAAEARAAAGPVMGFTDVTRESGAVHRHYRGEFDPKLSNIMPWISSIGSAAAVSDFDGDGDCDIYATSSKKGTPNSLFRNEGAMKFTNVAKEAGVADVNDADGVSMDAAFADLDNDGDDDLYIVEWGKDRLFRNDGGGRFTDITDASGTGDRSNGNAVLPFDYDEDGMLDLLVCNYFPSVDLCHLESTRIMHDSFEAARNGGANVLYHNLGGLKFEDVAHKLQLDDTGWSLDAGISDIDNDGDVDVYLANDFGQDKVYVNNGDGTFTDATEHAIGHETFKGMNIDFGDFNEDGFMDGYVANITTAEYLKEGNMLLLNGGGSFTNVAAATGTFDGGWGWCARFFDFDNDGHVDIYAVNGFVSAGPQSYWEDLANIAVDPGFDPSDATQWPPMGQRSLSGTEPKRLFRNRGDGSFEEVAQKYGLADRRDGRGIALADFDQDGDLDVFVANQDAYDALYRNDVGTTNRFVILSLVGTRSNRNAIGARVQVTASGGGEKGILRLTREVNGVNGYASESSLDVHFGLGQAERIDKLTVIWPSGVVQEFEKLALDKHYRIVEAGEPIPAGERAKYFFRTARDLASAPKGDASVQPKASPSILLDLEEKLSKRPCNVELANRYRSLCVDGRQFDRSIEFLRGLVRSHPRHAMVRLQLALAIVDKIPSLEGDVLGQGSLAKESLNELKWVAEADPDSYPLHYVSGMNHLYWPDSLKHFDFSVKHFEKCIEIQKARVAGGGKLEPHYAEAYRALGDAHVKGKRFTAARAVWTEGLHLFPDRESLQARLKESDESLTALVKDERGLKRRIDSLLDWLSEENGLARAEKSLASKPGDREILNAYRMEAFELGRVGRAQAFIEKLVQDHPESAEARLHLALAVTDRVNAIGAPTEEAFRLAKRIVEELAAFRTAAPGDWLGPYFTGICHLYRPASAEAASAAADAFKAAASLARRDDGTPRVPFIGMALGDALACAGDRDAAVSAWKETEAAFPRTRALKARMECPPESLKALVRAEYDLARGIPTDLAFLADREGELAALEKSLQAEPRARAAAKYRRLAREGEDRERPIRFLEALLAAQPRSANVRVQLALAYMDRIPDRELGSVRKGLLSSEGLKLLDPVAAASPDAWGVHYATGLIHLHWFTKQKHLPQAVSAFERCLAIGKGREKENPRFALAYQALGDALLKDRESPQSFPRGRRAWKEGLDLFPDDRGLAERMDLTAMMVNRYVDDLRNWSTPLDTGLLSDLIGDLPDLPVTPSG